MRTHQARCCFFRDTCFKEAPCLAAKGTNATSEMIRFRKQSTYGIHRQHTCIYSLLCTVMITPFDLCGHESFSSQARLQPVVCIIVSCPLIFAVCLSCIDCLVVPDRGRLGSFDMEKFVCLSVWSAEVRQPVCLFDGSIESTNRGGEVMGEQHSLMAFPPCVFFFLERSPDHRALHPNSQIRCLESLHMT